MTGLVLSALRDIKSDTPEWYVRLNMLNSYGNDIKKELAKINESFMYIGMKLSDIQRQGLYSSVSIRTNYSTLRSCNNVAEWASVELDMSKSTTYNLIGVYERFGTSDGFVKPAWKEYSFSQLCELLRFSELDDSIMGAISPSLTCREIRALNPRNASVSLDVKTIATVETVQALPQRENRSDVGISNDVLPNQIPMSFETFIDDASIIHSDVVTGQAVTPQDPQDTVYLHFANSEELRDWYFSDERKNASFPLTIAYRKTDKKE